MGRAKSADGTSRRMSALDTKLISKRQVERSVAAFMRTEQNRREMGSVHVPCSALSALWASASNSERSMAPLRN